MTAKSSSQPSLEQLPSAYIVSLPHYDAISLSGEEQTKYLQGQVTCDVTNLDEKSLLIGGHCDAKGKLYSVFRLFNHQDKHMLWQPKATLAASFETLKKFGVFSKVEIEQAGLESFVVAGKEAAQSLTKVISQLPDSLTPVIEVNDCTIIYLAGKLNHYLVVGDAEPSTKLKVELQLPEYPEAVWQLLELNEGFPALTEHAVLEYVPQMLNLQAIGGISFTKGCYLGQETVARMQYLGKNKRALFTLQGTSEAPVNAGDTLELALDENWRRAGNVINSYQDQDGNYLLQAVLASDLAQDSKLRLKSDAQSSFDLVPLPYSLT